MLEWIVSNKEWLFSGAGVSTVTALVLFVSKLRRKTANAQQQQDVPQPVRSTATATLKTPQPTAMPPAVSLDELKTRTHILFIDDDAKFKVVDILTKSGWRNTRRTSDVGSLDDSKIQQAHILFIDIQGVGRRLQFHDEGLGLAMALKEKHPQKKVVIYSAERQGERFHEALRKADDFLAKNADPYEFQQLTERLATELHRS